jgi:capsular exopolysaccharide synthesis family protein
MDLGELLPTLRRCWATVVGVLATVLVLAIAFVVVVPPSYRATAELYVATATPADATALAQSNSFALARVQSYADLAGAPEVTGPVIEALGLEDTPTELAGRIQVNAPIGKVLLEVSATDGSAEGSAAIANEVARRLAEYIERLETKDGGVAPVRLTLIDPAGAPASPVFPPVVPILILAVIVGLVAGAFLAVLRSRLDTKIRSSDDLGDDAPPLLATIAADGHAAQHPVASDDDPHGRRAEEFRQLRTTIDFLDLDSPPKVIAVASPCRGDGRTTTALNLAVSLADSGERVCLIEADLRDPSLAGLVDLDPELGLVSTLVGDEPISEFIQKERTNLIVLLAGGRPPNPNELLSSDRVRSVIAQVAAATDYVIVDTPPLLATSDGAEIASIADATLVVVRSGATTRPEFDRAVAAVELVGKQVAGVVLTMAKPGQTYGGYRYVDYRPAPA